MTRTAWLATLLLTLQGTLVAYGAWIHSPTFDETAHLPAGLAYWKLGREDIYPHNPPLVRSVAAVPVLLVGAKTQWEGVNEPTAVRPEFALGRHFVSANGPRAIWLYTLARWACLPFTLIGGYVCYHWSRQLYGPEAGLLSLWLWCFCPNVLGSGQWIAPDMAATSLGIAAGFLFWRWLAAPSWRRALAAGVGLGLAELTKFTWIILFVLWPAIWLCDRGPARRKPWQLVAALALGLYLLNLGYLFRGTLRPLEAQQYFSRALGGAGIDQKPNGDNRFRGHLLGKLPVPFPAAYLQGIDLQKRDFEHGYPSYLRGEWRDQGWWYYYLYGLGIKLPLGTLALLGWAAVAWGGIRRGAAEAESNAQGSREAGPGAAGRETRRDLLCLLVPPLAILALVSSQTGFNHHLRYVLPAYPFAFVFIGRLAGGLRRGRAWGAAVWILAFCTAAESMMVYPHSASFFNFLVGGPRHGAEHVLDSNISWGQDLLLLRRWLAEHPEARQSLRLAYFGNMDPRVAGIEFEAPPRGPTLPGEPPAQPRPADAALGPQPGWHVIDVNLLFGMHQVIPDGQGQWQSAWDGLTDLTYFRRFTPVDRIGYSLYVYRISLEEANRVRYALGLTPWPPAEGR